METVGGIKLQPVIEGTSRPGCKLSLIPGPKMPEWIVLTTIQKAQH